jgi:hypothetical protein
LDDLRSRQIPELSIKDLPKVTSEAELQRYCMYHGNKTNDHTKDFPIYIDTKKKMDQELA